VEGVGLEVGLVPLADGVVVVPVPLDVEVGVCVTPVDDGVWPVDVVVLVPSVELPVPDDVAVGVVAVGVGLAKLTT
jgi:hypothetical protein